jgi:hypothetical protein
VSTSPAPLSKWDDASLKFGIVLGVAAGAWTVVQTVQRILEIAPNRDVPVTAAFADSTATMPIGPGGAAVDVVPSQVILSVSDLPAITLWSLILAEVIYALAVVTVIALVCLVIRNVTRGQAFAPRTVGYIGTATIVVGVGWILTWLFRTMGANGGAAALAGESPVNTAFDIEPVAVFAIASMGVLAAAFQIGGKLQRENEGLV